MEDIKPKTYLIYIFNGWYIILFFLLGNILPLIILNKFIAHTETSLFLILIILTNVFAYFLLKRIALRPIRIYFDNEKIVFKFLSMNLKKIKKEDTIYIDQIRGFSDSIWGNDGIFKLKLELNHTYSIYKNRFWNKRDDFEILIFDFINFIESRNNSEISENDLINIKQKIEYKDFFQTKTATILFYGAIGLGTFVSIISIMGKTDSKSGSFIVIGGMIAYIGSYLAKRSKM